MQAQQAAEEPSAALNDSDNDSSEATREGHGQLHDNLLGWSLRGPVFQVMMMVPIGTSDMGNGRPILTIGSLSSKVTHRIAPSHTKRSRARKMGAHRERGCDWRVRAGSRSDRRYAASLIVALLQIWRSSSESCLSLRMRSCALVGRSNCFSYHSCAAGAGCGNAPFHPDMYTGGWERQICVDTSQVVIDQSIERMSASHPNMVPLHMVPLRLGLTVWYLIRELATELHPEY